MSKTVRALVRGMQPGGERPAASPGTSRGAGLRTMRELNRLLVLNCIRERGPVARVEIARRTGLSRTTVSSIVDALLDEGLAREGGAISAASVGGRRAIEVHFNESAGYVIGIDLGRSHCTVIATDLAACVLARHSFACDTNRGPAVCLEQVVDEVRNFARTHNVPWKRVLGVSMGIPGPMDAERHTLVNPPRMPGWDGVDVADVLRRELRAPSYVENDANMGALGESRFGAGRGVSDFAYVKVGTGIGCGLVIGGTVYSGSRGSAGELGHVTVDEDGPLCDCGNRGCLEAVTGASAILADALRGLSLAQRQASTAAPTESGCPLELPPNADIADVVEAALCGSVPCRAAVERAGALLGIALAGLVNLFNPSLILFDGGVTRAGEILIAPVREAIAARSLSAASHDLRIEYAALGDNAIALGAVAHVLDAAFGPPRFGAELPRAGAALAV